MFECEENKMMLMMMMVGKKTRRNKKKNTSPAKENSCEPENLNFMKLKICESTVRSISRWVSVSQATHRAAAPFHLFISSHPYHSISLTVWAVVARIYQPHAKHWTAGNFPKSREIRNTFCMRTCIVCELILSVCASYSNPFEEEEHTISLLKRWFAN